MKTINQILPSVLTAPSEPQTRAAQRNIADWEKFLGVETFHDAAISRMVNRCADFVLAFKDAQAPRWLTLLGNSGTGKTHCGKKAWKFCKERCNWSSTGYFPEKIYWPDFVSQLRSGTAFEHMRDLLDWPVLFLDDVGAERDTTGFASEQLNMLLGHREHQWTIITSNLSLENLGQIDPRIADRIIRRPNLYVDVDTKSYSLREIRKPHAND